MPVPAASPSATVVLMSTIAGSTADTAAWVPVSAVWVSVATGAVGTGCSAALGALLDGAGAAPVATASAAAATVTAAARTQRRGRRGGSGARPGTADDDGGGHGGGVPPPDDPV